MWVSSTKFFPCRTYVKHVNFIRLCAVSALAHFNPPIEEDQTINTHYPNPITSHFFELDKAKVVKTLNSLRDKPRLAFSYFNQLRERGFCHDPNTYAAIVRILCYWGWSRKLDSILLEIIKKGGSLDFGIVNLFEALAGGFEKESSDVLIRVSDTLVKVYVNSGMFDQAVDVLFRSKCRGFIPHILSCNFLLNQLIESGKVDMAIDVYRQLKTFGLDPNHYTYNIAIKAFCRKGSFNEAVEVFQDMEKSGVTPNAFAYTTYIQGLCLHGMSDLGFKVLQHCITAKIPIDVFAYTVVVRGFCSEMKLKEAESVFHEMQNQGFAPDVYVYSALIYGYCVVGNLLEALTLHDKMVLKGIKTNCVIVSSILQGLSKMGMAFEVVNCFNEFKNMGIFFDEACYNVVMDALCKLGKVEQAVELLVEMKRKGLAPDIVNYTTLINGFCLKSKVFDACKLFEEMKKGGHKPDYVTYDVLASGFSRNGLAQEALNLLKYMESQGVKPNTVTHNLIIEGLCIGGKVNDAEAFFDDLREKCLENYSSMFNGYCEANCMNKAFDLFISLPKQGYIMKKACCLKFKPSCSKLIGNLCSKGENEKAWLLLKTMLALNMDPTEIMYSKVIGTLCKAGEMNKAQCVFDIMLESGLCPDLITHTIMIYGYCRVNHISNAFHIFRDMKNRGIQPDVITYTVLLDSLSKIDVRSSHSIPGAMKSKENTVSSALWREKENTMSSALWREMKDMDIKPDVICYTVLIDKHCKTNNIQEAARKEEWAKVSAPELEINAAMQDLEFERWRLKGAQERIMPRETRLRASYSTTEEISILFAKQQEQLKTMQRTLKDEANYDNESVDVDLNALPVENMNGTLTSGRQMIVYKGAKGHSALFSSEI